MAYIEEFTIHGLAGHTQPVHRVLDRHINIFWGLNGTGKTSLLKILHSALNNDLDILRGVKFERAEVVFWSTDHQAKIRRVLERSGSVLSKNGDSDFEEDDGTRLEPMGDGLWREVSGPKVVASWASELLEGEIATGHRRVNGRLIRGSVDAPYRHAYMPISRLNQIARRRASVAAVVDDAYLDQEFASQVRSRWQEYNSNALIRIRAIQQQGLAAILAVLFGGVAGGSASSGDAETLGVDAYKLVNDFLSEQGIRPRFGKKEFLRRYDTQSDLRQVVANIEDVMREVELALRPQHEFQGVIEDLYAGGKTLVFDPMRARGSLSVEIEGEPIPLESLSSGEKQLLRLLLEILSAENATVMIDEPELSMHVDWQEVLVKSMRRVNPDCQLLLATHSPEVMADVDEKYVFEL